MFDVFNKSVNKITYLQNLASLEYDATVYIDQKYDF